MKINLNFKKHTTFYALLSFSFLNFLSLLTSRPAYEHGSGGNVDHCTAIALNVIICAILAAAGIISLFSKKTRKQSLYHLLLLSLLNIGVAVIICLTFPC